MRPMQILRRLTAEPPHKTLAKVYDRVKQSAGNTLRRRFDARHDTHCAADVGRLKSYLGGCDVVEIRSGASQESVAALDVLCERYLNHEFNLLGSGWVNVRHGMDCSGLNGQHYEPFETWSIDRDGEWLAGRLNAANLARSQSIWKLVDEDYVPIDWQLDFKSGYRWSEATWYRDIRLGHLPGVDIKVPWELARMQHLPQMALACCLISNDEAHDSRDPDGTSPAARAGNVGQPFQADASACSTPPPSSVSLERLTYDASRGDQRDGTEVQRLARAFRNQVLDFVATNPPRFGVNWQCAMDVGIRVANWLIARDLFLVAGVEFNDEFERVFTSAVYDHAQHIAANLEWSAEFRGNHYLADIAGLLFAAAYLPCSETTNAWLAFATRQLVVEVETQFLPDGGNFEASTCYHRLSAEMVVWCTALVLGFDEDKRAALTAYDCSKLKTTPRLEPAPVPMFAIGEDDGESPFPPCYFERLERMTEFVLHTTKPNGRLHQVGDNDSGRFFNVLPVIRSITDDPFEDQLDPRSVVAAANGLFGRDDFRDFCGSHCVETVLVNAIVNQAGSLDQSSSDRKRVHSDSTQIAGHPKVDVDTVSRETVGGHSLVSWVITLPDAVSLNDAEVVAYRDFGLYLWRTPRCYFAVRCGPVGQNGIGGHAHNDQLAIELQVDGRDWIADPGTYLYTPEAAARNRYRSVAAHCAPRLEDSREPGRLDRGLFRIDGSSDGECLYFGSDGFVGRHTGFGPAVTRVIRIAGNRIQIEDHADGDLKLRSVADVSIDCLPKVSVEFSSGYGVVD